MNSTAKLLNIANVVLLILAIFVIFLRVNNVDESISERTNLIGYTIDSSNTYLTWNEGERQLIIDAAGLETTSSVNVDETFDIRAQLSDWQILENGAIIPPSNCQSIELFQSFEAEQDKVIRIECRS